MAQITYLQNFSSKDFVITKAIDSTEKKKNEPCEEANICLYTMTKNY